jgi:hypothetical protein
LQLTVAVAGRPLPLSLSVDPFKIPDPSIFFAGIEPPAVGSVPLESADSKDAVFEDAVLLSSRIPARAIAGGTTVLACAEWISHPLRLALKSDPNGRKEVIDC